ncbi:MAG TPA: hypothetical protein VK548_04210 [Candidatus Acidoferrum sp.]|nr:hypothetical protein [Candidatus Acidoferrum sp.]
MPRFAIAVSIALALVATPVAFVATPVAFVATQASAEHTVYYRYVVLGFVKDAKGKPLPEQAVEVVRDKTGLAYPGRTDEGGLFVIVVRLGDESAGETLTVRSGGATTTVTARFDPANHVADRGTRVDLDGARFVERTAAFQPTLARFVGDTRH